MGSRLTLVSQGQSSHGPPSRTVRNGYSQIHTIVRTERFPRVGPCTYDQ